MGSMGCGSDHKEAQVCRVCKRPGAVPVGLTVEYNDLHRLLGPAVAKESLCQGCRDWTLSVAKLARALTLVDG